jgi:P27 family predicted phage terminase small subunit
MDLKANESWRPETAAFWNDLIAGYEFERAELEILRMAADAMDRFLMARDAINKDGLTVATADGGIKQHPAWSIEKAARQDFHRFVKTLGINTPTEIKRPGRPTARIGI